MAIEAAIIEEIIDQLNTIVTMYTTYNIRSSDMGSTNGLSPTKVYS